MSSERKVPGPAAENNERIIERGYDSDFARLPPEETLSDQEPGGGPHGTLDSAGTNLPVVVMAVGALVAFSTFLFASPWALGIGLAIVLVGALWAGMRTRHLGAAEGLGPTTVDRGERGET